MKKISAILVVGAAFAVLIGLIGIEARATHRARSAFAALAQRRTALNLGIERIAREIAADGREQARLRSQLEHPSVHAVAASHAETPVSAAALFAANPKLFTLYLRYYRAMVGQDFNALYRRLGLSPQQTDEFEKLATDHQDATFTLEAIALSEGLKDSDPAIATLQQQENDALHSGLIALLGESGYAQFQQAARLEPVWPLVNDLATRVALTATPLSESQRAELAQIIANASPKYRNGGTADADRAKLDWDEAIPQAQAILSESQLSVLKMDAAFAQVARLEDQFHRQQSAEK